MVRVWVAGKIVWSSCYTWAISECFRDKGLIYKVLYNFICLLFFTDREWCARAVLFTDADNGDYVKKLLHDILGWYIQASKLYFVNAMTIAPDDPQCPSPTCWGQIIFVVLSHKFVSNQLSSDTLYITTNQQRHFIRKTTRQMTDAQDLIQIPLLLIIYLLSKPHIQTAKGCNTNCQTTDRHFPDVCGHTGARSPSTVPQCQPCLRRTHSQATTKQEHYYVLPGN